MTLQTPFFREVGSGPGVVCLHANASTSSQWRALMDALAASFHVLAADSFGAGRSPAWPSDRRVTLGDEAALLEPVFDRAGEPFTLVGHSYGAAVALVAALARPDRVQALALYEPVLFGLLDAESPSPNEADGIRATVANAGAALDAGNPAAAAQSFIDYWMGNGAWARTPDSRKGPIAESMVHVRGWSEALFNRSPTLADFARLDVPVLYMMGSQSPASSRAVARLLIKALPRVRVIEFNALGHMGPITHPEIVNDAVARFLEQLAHAPASPGWLRGAVSRSAGASFRPDLCDLRGLRGYS